MGSPQSSGSVVTLGHSFRSSTIVSNAGTQVRVWIEQWAMSLDCVDLDLADPLEEIDPDEHAGALESGPRNPAELEHMHR
jgi:hypothetical protein